MPVMYSTAVGVQHDRDLHERDCLIAPAYERLYCYNSMLCKCCMQGSKNYTDLMMYLHWPHHQLVLQDRVQSIKTCMQRS